MRRFCLGGSIAPVFMYFTTRVQVRSLDNVLIAALRNGDFCADCTELLAPSDDDAGGRYYRLRLCFAKRTAAGKDAFKLWI